MKFEYKVPTFYPFIKKWLNNLYYTKKQYYIYLILKINLFNLILYIYKSLKIEDIYIFKTIKNQLLRTLHNYHGRFLLFILFIKNNKFADLSTLLPKAI